MALTGREDSVKREFDIIFGDVCKALGKVDMTAPLNGADRYFNADTMFSNYDNFFLLSLSHIMTVLKGKIIKNQPATCVAALIKIST